MNKIVLFGTGQVAALHYAHFVHNSSYKVVAFTVDRAFLKEKIYHDLPVVAFEEVEAIYPPDAYGMHLSISYRGVNRLRAEKYAQAKAKGYTLVSYISPAARVSQEAEIGENCTIGTNTVVDPYVKIGNNVSIASSCVIGHHTQVQDHCFLAAGVIISGSVTVEPYCFFGAGAVVRDRLKIAAESVIGAGAVILEDTTPQGVYLGKPADRLPIRSDQLPLG
jgi:sugar O-acyltransferase (sialic acid O-acetyltransferase NeuD family)